LLHDRGQSASRSFVRLACTKFPVASRTITEKIGYSIEQAKGSDHIIGAKCAITLCQALQRDSANEAADLALNCRQALVAARSGETMEVPLQIAFHNIDSSEWAENEIRNRVADLEKQYGRLNSCRIRVDQRAVSRTGSIPPVVRIELEIPGHKPLVVSHEPEHLQRKYQRPDLHNAIHEAFQIAERRLRDLKEQREGRTREPQHDSENQSLGQVAELPPGRDHGFLLTNQGSLLYFHRNAVLVGNFDKLRRGDEVHYVEEIGDTGPIASKVRVKAKE
jgi:ribosome-associated translation inhibitor RaiA/cold shock CspA family protein